MGRSTGANHSSDAAATEAKVKRSDNRMSDKKETNRRTITPKGRPTKERSGGITNCPYYFLIRGLRVRKGS